MEPDTKPDTGPLCIALVELGPSVALHVRCSIPLQQWTLTDGTCNVLARCTVQRVFGQHMVHAKTAKSANLNETGRRDEDHFLVDKTRKRGSKGSGNTASLATIKWSEFPKRVRKASNSPWKSPQCAQSPTGYIASEAPIGRRRA